MVMIAGLADCRIDFKILKALIGKLVFKHLLKGLIKKSFGELQLQGHIIFDILDLLIYKYIAIFYMAI